MYFSSFQYFLGTMKNSLFLRSTYCVPNSWEPWTVSMVLRNHGQHTFHENCRILMVFRNHTQCPWFQRIMDNSLSWELQYLWFLGTIEHYHSSKEHWTTDFLENYRQCPCSLGTKDNSLFLWMSMVSRSHGHSLFLKGTYSVLSSWKPWTVSMVLGSH